MFFTSTLLRNKSVFPSGKDLVTEHDDAPNSNAENNTKLQ
jgi:hypothetical protein